MTRLQAESVQGGDGAKSACLAVRLPPPSYSDIADHFRDLDATAEECDLQGVSYYLHKADKLGWLSAFRVRK